MRCGDVTTMQGVNAVVCVTQLVNATLQCCYTIMLRCSDATP